MTAYFILTHEATTNADELALYRKEVIATFEGHPITFHVVNGTHEVLEGEPIEGVVIASFPTVTDARAWYDSPAYQAVAKHRWAGARFKVVLVEGVD